jgi:hypothetical protein
MAVTVWAGDLVTGTAQVRVQPRSLRFQTVLNGTGSLEASFDLSASDYRPVALDPDSGEWLTVDRFASEMTAAFTPWRSFVAAVDADSGRVLEAGPVTASTWAATGQLLSVRASGLRAAFERRLVLDDSTPVAEQVHEWEGLELGGIASGLVALTLSRARGALPVVLPPERSGSESRVYRGYELKRVGDALAELQTVDGGPDVAFEPRIRADSLGVEWVMRVGSAAEPLLAQEGLPWVFDVSAPAALALPPQVDLDPSATRNVSYAVGDGWDTATRVVAARAVDGPHGAAGWPLLEAVENYVGVSDDSVLAAHAEADLASNLRPWREIGLTVLTEPWTWDVRPGDWALVRTDPADPVLAGETLTGRVVEMGASLDDQFTSVRFAPVMGQR